LLTAFTSHAGINYHWCLILPLFINAIWAFVIFKNLPSKPEEIEPENQPLNQHPLQQHHRMETVVEEKKALSKETTPNNNVVFRDMVENVIIFPMVDEYIGLINIVKKAPSIICIALSLGFLKFISYALFFNLPLLMTQIFSITQSSLITLFFDLGMCIGGITVGFISDKVDGRRSSIIIISSFLIIPLMSALAMDQPISAASSLVILLCIGILLGGGNNILSSAVCVDISDREVFLNSSTALPKITGLINGIASLISSIGLIFLGPAETSVDFRKVWFILIISCILSIVFLCPIVVFEILSYQQVRPPIQRQGYDAIPSLSPSKTISFTNRDYL